MVLLDSARGGMHPSLKQQYVVAHNRDFGRLKHAPRTSAGTQTCIVIDGRASCVPRSRKREKKPAAEGDVLASVQTKDKMHTIRARACAHNTLYIDNTLPGKNPLAVFIQNMGGTIDIVLLIISTQRN